MAGLRTWAAVATFVVIALLCVGSVESKSRHYAVRVKDPADLQQVSQRLLHASIIKKGSKYKITFLSTYAAIRFLINCRGKAPTACVPTVASGAGSVTHVAEHKQHIPAPNMFAALDCTHHRNPCPPHRWLTYSRGRASSSSASTNALVS